MLTIDNIEKSLSNNVIAVFDDSYWKIIKVYSTNFQYRIDVEENTTKEQCWFSLIRKKDNNGYTLYTHIKGKKLKNLTLTNETLSTPKEFLFQLECSLISILSPF